MKITWKMKTMTTEVLFNEDDYVWGEWTKNNSYSPIQQMTYLENESYYRVGHKKKLQKLEVGKVYTTKNTSTFVCLTKVGSYRYMIGCIDQDIFTNSPAYAWNDNGSSISLDSGYDVDWSVEPYGMSINE